jgi:hypothetical protein
MSLNIKRLEVTVPFNLIDLNGDSSFKAFFDFVKKVESLSENNKDLCDVTEQKVIVKDTETYDQITNIKNKNKNLLDQKLLKKEQELYSKNIYEATVSILYNISFDTEIIKAYTELQTKLLKLKTIPTVRVHSFYDPKKMLFESACNLKKYKVTDINLSSVKGEDGIYKTGLSYIVPYDENGSYPKSFAVLKKNIKRKLILNYDYPVVLEDKKNFKDIPNASFDIYSDDKREKEKRYFISSLVLDENKYTDGPISFAKREKTTNELGKSVFLDDELAKFYFNCITNNCESVSMNIHLNDDSYNSYVNVKFKEKELSKFTTIIDHCTNNLTEKDMLLESNTFGPDSNGNIEFIIGTYEKIQLKTPMSL